MINTVDIKPLKNVSCQIMTGFKTQIWWTVRNEVFDLISFRVSDKTWFNMQNYLRNKVFND